MNDAIGNELKPGDEVIYFSNKSFFKGIIVKMHKVAVRIENIGIFSFDGKFLEDKNRRRYQHNKDRKFVIKLKGKEDEGICISETRSHNTST